MPRSGMGAARQGGINLVVYDSSHRPVSQLDVYDPDHSLPKL